MLPISGKSILNILRSAEQGTVDESKKYVFSGRERHSASRYLNWGYPQRVIRSKEFLLIRNIKPERWPAGAPQRLVPGTDELYPVYGIDEDGVHHSDWAFTDIDAAPTKSFIIENRESETMQAYFEGALAKRPEYELFNIIKDPYCLNNLSGKANYLEVEQEMKQVLNAELERSRDPRVVGPDTEIFDSYIRYSPMREFPKPSG